MKHHQTKQTTTHLLNSNQPLREMKEHPPNKPLLFFLPSYLKGSRHHCKQHVIRTVLPSRQTNEYKALRPNYYLDTGMINLTNTFNVKKDYNPSSRSPLRQYLSINYFLTSSIIILHIFPKFYCLRLHIFNP
jgi:hypothetical protein